MVDSNVSRVWNISLDYVLWMSKTSPLVVHKVVISLSNKYIKAVK